MEKLDTRREATAHEIAHFMFRNNGELPRNSNGQRLSVPVRVLSLSLARADDDSHAQAPTLLRARTLYNEMLKKARMARDGDEADARSDEDEGESAAKRPRVCVSIPQEYLPLLQTAKAADLAREYDQSHFSECTECGTRRRVFCPFFTHCLGNSENFTCAELARTCGKPADFDVKDPCDKSFVSTSNEFRRLRHLDRDRFVTVETADARHVARWEQRRADEKFEKVDRALREGAFAFAEKLDQLKTVDERHRRLRAATQEEVFGISKNSNIFDWANHYYPGGAKGSEHYRYLELLAFKVFTLDDFGTPHDDEPSEQALVLYVTFLRGDVEGRKMMVRRGGSRILLKIGSTGVRAPVDLVGREFAGVLCSGSTARMITGTNNGNNHNFESSYVAASHNGHMLLFYDTSGMTERKAEHASRHAFEDALGLKAAIGRSEYFDVTNRLANPSGSRSSSRQAGAGHDQVRKALAAWFDASPKRFLAVCQFNDFTRGYDHVVTKDRGRLRFGFDFDLRKLTPEERADVPLRLDDDGRVTNESFRFL